jgi:hypothetical protein
MARSRRWPLAFIVLALASFHSTRAPSQEVAAEPAGNPLPVVVYPPLNAGTQPPGQPPAEAPPPPVQIVEQPAPVYYFVNGVWGFWDREGHFHHKPITIIRGSTGTRSNVIAIRPEHGFRTADQPMVETVGQPPSRYRVGLSNPPPRVIVVQSPASRERGLMR